MIVNILCWLASLALCYYIGVTSENLKDVMIAVAVLVSVLQLLDIRDAWARKKRKNVESFYWE